MSDEVSLQEAMKGMQPAQGAPAASGPKQGEVSLASALKRVPDNRTGFEKDKSTLLKAIKSSLTPKQIKSDGLDSYTWGLLQTGADAVETAVAKATHNQAVLDEQEKEFAERRKSARARGEDPDKTMGEKIKEIPKDLANVGKGLSERPLTTGFMLLKSLMYDAPTFVVGGMVGVPAKVGKVAAALTRSEKAIAASKAVGAVAEGGAIGAAGESAHEHVTQGEATAGGALKGAAQMAMFDVGMRAVGIIRGARGKYKGNGEGVSDEEREFVNKPGGGLTTAKKRTETPINFMGRDEPTPYENIQARALFANDAEYVQYLTVHADQLAQKPAIPLLEMAAKDSHTAVKAIQREVNGGKAGQAGKSVAENVERFRSKLANRHAREDAAQGRLDDMEERGESPQEVAQKFWEHTYQRMHPDDQKPFLRLLQKHSGRGDKPVGDVAEAAKDLDLPDKPEHLEGSSRGFVAMMDEANHQFGDERIAGAGANAKAAIARASAGKSVADAMRAVEPRVAQGAAVAIDKLREQYPGMGKEAFDKMILDEAEKGNLELQRHAWPAKLKSQPGRKEKLIPDGRGGYFDSAGLRRPPEETSSLVTDVHAKEILDTPPESRTPAQRAALKKWQMRGMLGAAGGGFLAYSLADQDTQKAMLAMGVMAATPMGKEHWEALEALKGKSIAPADLPESGKDPENSWAPFVDHEAAFNKFVADKQKKYGVSKDPYQHWSEKLNDNEKNQFQQLATELAEKAHSKMTKGGFRLPKDHPFVNTPEFRAWFRDSKIKDEDGNPLIMYHGTAQNISVFKGKQAGSIFISPNPSFSAIFSEMSRDFMERNPDKVFNKNELKALEHAAIRERAQRLRVTEEQAKQSMGPDIWKSPEFRTLAKRHTRSGPNLIPVFVRAEKPWDYEKWEDTAAVADKVGELAPPEAEWDESDTAQLESELMSGNWDTIESKEVQKAIKALGYDSFYMLESGNKNLAVYKSEQVKSVSGNSGKYGEVPNIEGSAQTEFLALLAGAGLGALIGSQMDKDESPIRTTLIGIFGGVLLRGVAKKVGELPEGTAGRVARGAAESMAPGAMKKAATKMASKIPGGEKAPKGGERVRIKDAIVDYQLRLARTAREVMQLTRMAFEKVPSLDRRQEISRALDGEMVALSKNEREVFEALKAAFRKIGDDAVAAGVLDELRENYITHLVKRGQEEKVKKFLAQVKGGPSMNPTSPYAKERTFKGFMSEMEKAGIELESKDAATIYGKYAFAMQRSIANANLLSALKNDVRGIFVPAGPKAPAGFVTIDRPLLLGQKVHPDIVPELTALFDTRDPDAWVKVVSALNTATKRASVSFSMFHAMSLTQAFAASQGKIKTAMAAGVAGAAVGAATGNDPYITGLAGVAAGMFGPAAKKGYAFARGTDSLIKQIREGGHGDVVDTAMRDGLSISMERQRPVVSDVAQDFYTGMENIQGFVDKFVHPVAGKAVEKIAKVNHAVDNIMWGRLHAGMKLEVYMDKKSKLLMENAKAREKSPEIPLMSEERAGEIAATYANTLFGGLNWTRMMESFNNKFARSVASALTSPTGLRYLNIALFAPDWTISTTMSALRAGDIRPSQRELSSLHRQYMIRAALYTAAAAEALNYASTGKHLWEEEDWTVVHLGDGSTMQLSKHFFEPFEWARKGTQEAINKLGTVPTESMEQLFDKEYLTTKRAPKIKNRAEHLAKRFVPMGVGQAADGNVMGGVSGTLGVPIYPPKKKKKKADEYLDESMQ